MPPSNRLTQAPPFAIETAVKKVGKNLRVARVRRNISAAELAARLGVGRHVIAYAEAGKLTTSIAVYVGMLWAMNLLTNFEEIASPENDTEGTALARHREPVRPRSNLDLSNDF